MAGLHDDRQVATNGLHFFDEFQPVHAGHHEIKDHQLDAAAIGSVQDFQALDSAICCY
jgi:hypothetical protein